MVESRCGILCGSCHYKEQTGCKGCLQVKDPFWGTCPVKACCEERGLQHCGECRDFACDLLKQFAYDKEQGDNGARIEQCRRWKA